MVYKNSKKRSFRKKSKSLRKRGGASANSKTYQVKKAQANKSEAERARKYAKERAERAKKGELKEQEKTYSLARGGSKRKRRR